jgi:hypothetical protein
MQALQDYYTHLMVLADKHGYLSLLQAGRSSCRMQHHNYCSGLRKVTLCMIYTLQLHPHVTPSAATSGQKQLRHD